jgi:hypothetical protein
VGLVRQGRPRTPLKGARAGTITNCGPVRLYLDDIEYLHARFVEHTKRVTMEADGFVVPEPAELAEVGRTIRRFSLMGFEPGVVLKLEPYTVWAYCDDATDHCRLGAVVADS